MKKIKVGDKVRCLIAEDACVIVGKTYLVLDVDKGDNTVLVKINELGDVYWLSDTSVEPLPKTIEDLEVGDILVADKEEAMVLGVCGNVYCLSYLGDFDSANDWYTLKEIKDDGWKLKDSEDTVKVYTKQDIADKIKEDINNFKIEG